MGSDNLLGAFEELVLLAVAQEGEQAYGMRVRREIERRADREVTIGAVYATLDRLEDKGLLESVRADVGTRARRFFRVTPAGARALLEAAAMHRRMWDAIDRAALESLAGPS